MKKTYIIHGWPTKEEYYDKNSDAPSNSHWIPWLEKQLLINDIHAQAITMPKAWRPDYNAWKETFEQFNMDDDTILVGHSCGAGFLVRYLSENKIKIEKIILVAPWLDLNHKEREHIGDFFDFNIDSNLSDITTEIIIFVSEDDDEEILDSVNFLKENLKECLVKKFKDKGHFTLEDMGTREFPDLLNCII